MATAEQLAAFQTAVALGNIQEAANIAASAGYSPQQVAEYVNANAPVLGLGPETGFSGVTAANLNPYFVPTPVSGPPSPAVSPVVANPISLTSAGTASLGQPTNASSPVNVFSPADYGPPSPIFDPAPAPVDPNVEKFNSLIREGKFGEAGVLATGLGFTPEQIQSYLNDTNVFPEFGGGVTLKTVQSIVSPPPPPVVSDSPPAVNQTSAPTTPPAYDIRDLFLEFLGREPKPEDLSNAQFLYGDKLDTPNEINEFITKSKQEILNRQSFPVNSLFEGGKQPSLEELRRVQNDPLTQALSSFDQYLLAGKYPEAKSLLDSTISTYGLNPTESYTNIATYLNTNPKFEGVRETAGNKLFTSENIANFGKLSPAASVGPAGGIYQRTPEQQAAYASQLASIPVNTAVPLPVMPMSIGPSAAMARIQRTGEMTPEQYYSNIRESVSSGQYTPAQLRQMQQGVGASSQDINVAFGRGMTPIGQLQPGAGDVSVDIPGQFVTEDGGQPKPLSVDISSMPKEQQDLTKFIVGKLPRPTTTSPSMFSPENVRAQLELERLRLQPTPEPPPEEPVAGFAQGGLVSDDINRMLQNQRNAIQRESQSRQMLTNLGAPPVKKFSDGGPAGSSSGVRRLKMSGYQAGGEVNENPYVRMAREERAAQDKAFDSVNRQLSDLLERYKEGDEGITEKDLLPFFPGYNEYDIAQMYGTTTESSVPSMSSKARSFTPEIMSNLRKHDELMQKDFDSLVKEKRLPRDVITARTLGLANGGEVTNDEFIQEMLTGTRPEDFPETSPVDTAVSDFISSRSKLVTDPQEFFRVMGQNIEEYHGKPLREDPQKYLTEQLGPGALAGTVGKTAKQLFSSLPSSEAPFVGRLDEFVSSLPGAVQKDQFLNQLKGKFRDYDIGRAQEALADLPGNAKLTPFELLNRVKRVYDPTTFTTKIDYPKIDDYHAEIDNPFQTKKGFSQKPLGVIHLLQGVNPTTSPDAAKLMAAYEDITNRLPGTTFYSFDKTDRNPVSLAQDIYKIASRAGLSSVEDLGMDVQTVLQNMSQSGSDWSKLISAKTMLGNPGRYRPEEIKEVLNETARITGALPEENVKSLQKIAEEINARRTAKQDYSDLESQYHKSFPYAFAEDLEKANRRLWNEHREGKQQIEGLLEGLQKREGIKARVYRGQHSSLAEDSSTIRDPIAFSRFTEHTTDIPGLGKVDGIYVNELQSDRLDDIRKKGRMGGGPQEDITRLDKLDKQIGEAARQFADYKTAMGFRFMNETDKAKISDFNSKLEGLNTKRNTLLDRIREGEYSLKESFAGMEESPQVIQQLMAKNAVAGAMQLGKRFVAFPGAESAQSQLYEKLPNNLKQVVKDLGPGFELRPITLPKPDTSAGGEGGELTSYAIVWGNEAADRIKKQGVPFKDGGEVSTEDFVKRFSKGEISNDEFIQMMTGTRPTDETTSPGILPPEIRQAIDVPLDFANLLIRGTAAVPIGGAAGLYKGITGGKYGTQEGVKEADTEAARMMAKITGEPKTQTAKDVLEFIGGKAQEYKLDAALPQLLTLPSPGPGAASALMRSYELAETPPLGTVKLAGDKGVKPATPPTDQMGFYSPAEKAVMGLPQDKGTASQMLAQITKTQGVKPVELRATGLEDYLKGKGNEPVTKQEIQDFLTNNRVQVDEVVLGKGQTLSPEAKKLSGEALSRMEEVDDKLASYFEGVEEVAGQDPYSAFIMLRSSIGRRAAKGDQEALDELNAFNLPPEIKDLVLEFGRNKNEYIKYTSQARKMEKPKFDGYNTSGGTNAREIYLTLPGEQMPSSSPPSVNAQGVLVKPMYATQPKFTAPPQHSVSPEADANRLAHIFLDERKDAKGDKVLFVQEMQSDWAQIGKKKGFQTKTTPYDDPEYKAARARATDLLNEFNRNNANPVRQQEIRPLLDEARRVEQSFEDSRQKLPAAPFVTNTEDWVNLALKRVIKEAVDNDIDTVAFIKGGQAADKYSLRTFVDQITADRGFATGDDLYVSITPKDSLSPHAFYVGPDGVIKEPISADVRSKFLGEPLSKVIGKEAAEKLLSTKIGESQVLRDEGLTLGGKGMEGFYDNILPKTAEKLLKKLGGGKVEPVEMVKAAPSQMPYEANAFLHWMSFRHPGTSRSDAARAWGMGMDNNQFVKEFYEETTPKADQYLGFKITPEMKEMVKTEGLPKFAAGGEVTDFIKRAA
jgi:hypothetical protein